MKNKYLAIIPARGGSKRLPNKNILDLDGKPLIAHTIESSLKSKYIDKVVVTSDSDKILEIAKFFKANTIKRPNNLATDTSTPFKTIKHTLKNNDKFKYLILLQPTSPLRGVKEIDEAIELLENKKADAVISVSEMEHSPLWANTLNDTLSMENFLKKEVKNKRSQDLDKYFRLNGAIYICKISKFLKEKTLFLEKRIFAYKMEPEKSIDIDTKLDFIIVETIIKNSLVSYK
jgi:CMP-N-acetylneuraminic acid synthetase